MEGHFYCLLTLNHLFFHLSTSKNACFSRPRNHAATYKKLAVLKQIKSMEGAWQKSNPLSESRSWNDQFSLFSLSLGLPQATWFLYRRFSKEQQSLNIHKKKFRIMSTHNMFANICSTYWFCQYYWLLWLGSCGQTRANNFLREVWSTSCRCMQASTSPTYPSLAGRYFRTSLQEVALQTCRLFKVMHRYRDDFHVKKIRLTP